MNHNGNQDNHAFKFPFAVGEAGRISASGGDEALRGKIIQVLFTAPGERVHRPEFGCGLLNLVFEPNDAVLAAAVEYTIGQALSRWLSDEIMLDGVSVTHLDETIAVDIAYTRKRDRSKQALRVRYR